MIMCDDFECAVVGCLNKNDLIPIEYVFHLMGDRLEVFLCPAHYEKYKKCMVENNKLFDKIERDRNG